VPPVVHDTLEPACEVIGWQFASTKTGEIEMGVGIYQPWEDRAIAEINLSALTGSGLDRADAIVE
jgi:hypothetical protein